MAERKMTSRQLEALEASYRWNNPHARVLVTFEGERRAQMEGARQRAGGASKRMVEDLVSTGYITRYNYRRPEDGEWGHLTVKGYEALRPHCVKRGISEEELDNQCHARRLIEEGIVRREEAEKAERQRRAEEQRKREREKLTARFRQLFRDHGVPYAADTWPDEKVLEFAEQAGDAVNYS